MSTKVDTARPTDQQLVGAIMAATEHLSLRERERATGLSHATFQRFGHGYGHRYGWKVLQKETRAKVTAYLERSGKMPAAVPDRPLNDPERARLLELWEEMGRILRAG